MSYIKKKRKGNKMNKEQIQKHGEVIKWFINNPDKGVWLGDSSGDWSITYEPTFVKSFHYVQNDEYAEFRKAYFDGKTIEVYLGSYWVDFTNNWGLPIKYYRIKPEEPEFKKGDWVRVSTDWDKPSIIKQYDKFSTPSSKGCNHEWAYRHIMKDGTKWTNCELWKPKENELCVFYDYNEIYLSIQPFAKYYEGLYHTTFNEVSINIAPLEFISTLKCTI